MVLAPAQNRQRSELCYSGSGAPSSIRVPPIQPRAQPRAPAQSHLPRIRPAAPSSGSRATHPARRVPLFLPEENPKILLLGDRACLCQAFFKCVGNPGWESTCAAALRRCGTAVRCGALRALRCAAARCGALRCAAVGCGALRCAAARCGVAVCCGALRCFEACCICLVVTFSAHGGSWPLTVPAATPLALH